MLGYKVPVSPWRFASVEQVFPGLMLYGLPGAPLALKRATTT
jgi:hypothetical protein